MQVEVPSLQVECLDRLISYEGVRAEQLHVCLEVLVFTRFRKKMGACLQCSTRSCLKAFHVTCAQQSGMTMKIESSLDPNNAEMMDVQVGAEVIPAYPQLCSHSLTVPSLS